MIDGRWKAAQDRVWDHAGRALAKTGVTANQITIFGTLAMFAHAAAFCVHRDLFWFGVGIAALELTDDLDGAVARVTGTSSAFGAYLDATTDRYKDLVVYAALGHVLHAWPLAFACASGALLTSYAKARAGMEAPISNDRWPDLFERLERIVVLVAGLVVAAFAPRVAGRSVAEWTLVILAVGTHLTALQRMARARAILRRPSE